MFFPPYPIIYEDGYVIYRSDAKNGTYNAVKTVKSADTKSCKNTGLTAGKTYYNKIRAYKTVNGSKIFGDYSAAVSAKPDPAKVKGLKEKAASAKSVKLTWTRQSKVNGYVVYRAAKKDGKYSKVKTITAKTASFTDKKLTTGKVYYYKVRSYVTVNGKKVYGAYSSAVSAKPSK